MSSCQCCLKPHPFRLLERYLSSIQSIKIIRKNSFIFEQILLNQSEQFERIIFNLNKYFIEYSSISYIIFTNYSQLIKQFNDRLNQLRKYFYELEYLIIQCSIWLKTNNRKKFYRQLKLFKKQFENWQKYFTYPCEKLQNDFSKFQYNYNRQVLQMDLIEYEHLKLFQENSRIFSSILSLDNSLNIIDIKQIINQWKEQYRFHIPWLFNEHQTIEQILPLSSSEIDIKPIDDCVSQDTYVHTSNLSWSFTLPTPNEDLSVASQSTDHSILTTMPKNRVQLAIEAIEGNHNQAYPRGKKS